MSAIPKFVQLKPSFHTELKKRIANYFETTGKVSTGNYKLWMKAAILIVVLIGLYIHLVFFTPSAIWAIAECIILGATVASTGFNVMHDGGHGSFSNSPLLNKMAAATLGFLGGSHFIWNVRHNIVHHAYTNIDGMDDDIDANPFLRVTSTQKKYKMHRFQHWYFWFFYCWIYIHWIFFSDYKKYFSRKVGEMSIKKMALKDHLYFWMYKIINLILFLVLPIVKVGVIDTIIGYFIMTFVAGFILGIVFQLAHTVEHTHFPMPDEANKMEDEWAIHQLKTTANFATKNKAISWYVGGLNFQIEHHLFPKVSHVHYPKISKIIKEACQEYNVTYIEYPRMYQAVISHVSLLRQMGKAQ